MPADFAAALFHMETNKPVLVRTKLGWHLVEITARKAAEDALRSREAQYRAIFDGSADALVLWDRRIHIVDVNAAFTRMYGYLPEEVA